MAASAFTAGGLHFYRIHKTKLLTVSLLYAPPGAQPVAYSTVVCSTIVYVLRTIRLAIGSDRGDLPWTAEDGKMQSLASGPTRGQNGEADRDRYSLKWTVPLHTGSGLVPNQRLEHSDITRSMKC